MRSEAPRYSEGPLRALDLLMVKNSFLAWEVTALLEEKVVVVTIVLSFQAEIKNVKV